MPSPVVDERLAMRRSICFMYKLFGKELKKILQGLKFLTVPGDRSGCSPVQRVVFGRLGFHAGESQ